MLHVFWYWVDGPGQIWIKDMTDKYDGAQNRFCFVNDAEWARQIWIKAMKDMHYGILIVIPINNLFVNGGLRYQTHVHT